MIIALAISRTGPELGQAKFLIEMKIMDYVLRTVSVRSVTNSKCAVAPLSTN